MWEVCCGECEVVSGVVGSEGAFGGYKVMSVRLVWMAGAQSTYNSTHWKQLNIIHIH